MKKIFFTIIAICAYLAIANNDINAKEMENKDEKLSAFPIGEALPKEFSKYFIGQAYLAPLTKNGALNCPIHNVTFEPGCRNAWHSHTGGQILIAVGGKGYYQEKNGKVQVLNPGDVVEIAPNVVHWHGATADSWFSHIAIECNPQSNKNSWYDAVEDEYYNNIKNHRL